MTTHHETDDQAHVSEFDALRAVATGVGQIAKNRERAGTVRGDREAKRYRAIQERVRAAANLAKHGPVTRDAMGNEAKVTARDLKNAAEVHLERAARARVQAGASPAQAESLCRSAAKNQAMADALLAVAARLEAG